MANDSGPSFHSKHTIDKVINYEHLSPSYRKFVLSVSDNYTPSYYYQAVKHEEWRLAMAEELQAMEANKT